MTARGQIKCSQEIFIKTETMDTQSQNEWWIPNDLRGVKSKIDPQDPLSHFNSLVGQEHSVPLMLLLNMPKTFGTS